MKTRRAKTPNKAPKRKPKARKSPPRRAPSLAKLQAQLDLRTRERDEALEQQAATSEMLKVISSSPGDLQPVFNAMLENAVRLCDAKFGSLFLYKDGAINTASILGVPPKLADFLENQGPPRPMPGSPLYRVLHSKRVVHVTDEMAEAVQSPAATLGGSRSTVAVPMLKDDELIGAIVIYRQEVRPFTDKQVELVSNFAAQAVIAIENTRLLHELRQRTDDLSESLEQQTATSEVLKVISSSPGELQPVFDAMLENATRICDAKFGVLFRFDGELFRMVAEQDLPPQLSAFLRQRTSFRPQPGSVLELLSQTKTVAHIEDDAARPSPGSPTKFGGARTTLAVPMLKDNTLVGAFGIFRQEVRPFTGKQIELLENFAAQAVIAIENTRLLHELRQRTDDLGESLEQQTATSEVLQVISGSPGDLQPVFQAMLEKASRVCEAKFGMLFLSDGNGFRTVAHYGAPQAFIDARPRDHLVQTDPETALGRVAVNKQAVQIADIRGEPAYKNDPRRSELLELAGARTMLNVPMLKNNELIGQIAIYRQEVRPFTDKQIELVTNFAAQAVIAIENTRLLSDLRQSLQQQTATADVLKVISRSTFDLQTVLDTLVESAARLSASDYATINRQHDSAYRQAASYGQTPEAIRLVETTGIALDRTTVVGRTIMAGEPVQIVDVLADPEFGLKEVARRNGTNTILGVPLLREGSPIGVMTLQRRAMRAYSDKEIELLISFADQAVIAIENVRLFDEVQKRTDDLAESLEYQTATGEILGVLSKSPTHVQPVFDGIAASALRLCNSTWTSVLRFDGEMIEIASLHNLVDFDGAETIRRSFPRKPSRTGATDRAISTKSVCYIPDVLKLPDYDHSGLAQVAGYRSILSVPMLLGGKAVGAITAVGAEPNAFTERQIALLRTFADQAVIAIENVRLFDEIQDKSHQLAEASRHKSQFLANMSHELRTPLNAILGYTELVLDGVYGEAPEKALTVLKRVESNGKHLLGLINDVLDLSKIEAGELKLSLTDYSMKDVVYGVFSAVEPLATRKKLDFKVNMPPDMPAGQGDERRLTQVLLNLVGNAIKFTDAGEVAIRVAATDGSFSVAVHDTGPGISPANQAKLFQEFQQADSSITKAKGGTGLGLAISRRIIELHGGRIWVDSSPGDGSTFTFTLPIVVEQQAGPS